MTNPIDKLKRWAAGAILARFLKKAAEGGYGPKVQRLYWALAGSKTWIAAGLAFIAGSIEVGQRVGLCDLIAAHWPEASCATWLVYVQQATAWSSAAFLFLGQVDGAVRTEPPAPGSEEGFRRVTGTLRFDSLP